MKGIYYKEGIYVLIESDGEHNDCIYHYNYRSDALSLFGGRVEVNNITYYEKADLTQLAVFSLKKASKSPKSGIEKNIDI